MKILIWGLIVIALIVAAFGILHWVRRQIAASREDLEQVDRSKLRDLDNDAWADEEREKDGRKR